MPIAKEEDSHGDIFLQNILEKFIFLPYSEITPAMFLKFSHPSLTERNQ